MTNGKRILTLIFACMMAGLLSAQTNLKAGTYYIQNVATGKFLTAGANYGYQGVLNTHGLDIKVTGSGTSFLLTTDLNQAGYVLKPTDGFLDGTSSSDFKWTIAPQDDGTYTIYSKSKEKYYGYDASYTYPYVIRFLDTDDGSNTRWRFWTKASLKETLTDATTENPVDASFLMVAPDFVRGDHRIITNHCWGDDLTATGGNKDSGCTLLNSHNAEQLNKTSWNVSQTLKNIPNGIYKLSMQGFSRYGSTSTGSPAAYLNGTEERLYHLFAGNRSTDIMSVYTQAQTTQSTGFNRQTDAGYVPDNQAQAAVCFTDGYYVNTLDGILVTDNTLTLGVRKDAKSVQNDWVCFDNFTLLYYGCDLAAVKATALEQWQTYNAKTVEGGDRATYNAVLDSLKAEIEGAEDVKAIGKALAELQPTYEIYQSSPEVNGSPLTLTGMLTNADFKAGSTGWTMKSDYSANFVVNTSYEPAVVEAYAGWQNFDLKSFSIQQEKSIRLAEGKYRLTVPALYRYGGDYDSDAKSNKNVARAYIFANNTRKAVMHMSDIELGKYPNNMSESSAAFANGYYKNQLVFELTEPTDVTIGMKGSHAVILSWFIAGPMTLEKIMGDEQLEAYLMRWEKLSSIANQALDHSAFDAAVEEGKAAATEEELAQADAAITEAFHTLLKTGTPVDGQFDLTSLIDVQTTGENALEIYNQTSGAVEQTIPDLPAGTYTMKVQAFHRPTSRESSSIAYEKGTDVVAASLYLGEETTAVRNINDDARYIPHLPNEYAAGACQRSIPNSLAGATDAFNQGLYWNTLTTTLKADGDVNFGLKLKDGKSENWLTYRKFRLYYGTGIPTVQLSVDEPYTIEEDKRANVSTDIVLRAGEYNKVCLPFDLTTQQVKSTFTAAYILGGVNADGIGQLVPVSTMKAGECYFVSVDSQKLLSANNVLLRATVPDSLPVIWDGAATVGSYNGYSFDVNLTTPGTKLSALQPIDFADVQFTTNLENWQARRFLNGNTYDYTSASVVSLYNQAPPSRRDQPHSVFIPVPTVDEALTLTVKSSNQELNFQYPAGTTLCEVPNLVPQTTYTYTVKATGNIVTKGQFTTQGHLRMIKATSGANIRDLGGWQTIDGLHTRYGLIYRGGELNAGHTMNADDIAVLRDLGIRGEVDLREDVDFSDQTLHNASALGSDVNYTYENLGMWNDDALQLVTEKFKDAFNLTLNTLRNGNSVYFHCIWGADRTGCYAMLLEGLLGVTTDQLYKDYELTTFSHAGLRSKDGLDSKFNYIRSLPGNTLQEQFYNYWHLAVGIPKADLLEFITLMVDGHSSILDAELPEVDFIPVVADGDYYLYDSAKGLFFSRGDNWGTRFVQDNYGVPVHISTNNFGTTKVQFLDSQLYLGSDGYTDKAVNYNSITWNMEQRGEGFVLKSSNGYYLAMDDRGFPKTSGTTADVAIVFTPKSLTEHQEILADKHRANIIAALQADGQEIADEASADDIQTILDAYVQQPSTARIKSPKTGSTTNWVLTSPENEQDVWNQYNTGTYGGELYQKCGTISQTVNMPHPGLYRLTLTALYREGQNTNCYQLGQQGYELSNAWVSINDTWLAQIPSWYSACTSSTTPDNTTQTKTLMDAGKYAFDVFAYVGEDLKATITIHVPGFVGGGWCLFNNFAFTEYIAEGSSINELSNANYPMSDAVFDLCGRQMTNSKNAVSSVRSTYPKGIYIIRRKKMVVH